MEVLGVETLQIFRQHPEPCNPILIYIYTHTYIYIHIYIHIFFLICLSSVFFCHGSRAMWVIKMREIMRAGDM